MSALISVLVQHRFQFNPAPSFAHCSHIYSSSGLFGSFSLASLRRLRQLTVLGKMQPQQPLFSRQRCSRIPPLCCGCWESALCFHRGRNIVACNSICGGRESNLSAGQGPGSSLSPGRFHSEASGSRGEVRTLHHCRLSWLKSRMRCVHKPPTVPHILTGYYCVLCFTHFFL